MANIILSKEATLKNAIGTHINHLSKAVLCITDKKWFASVTDTAEAYEVSIFAISAVCNGKTNTCKGKRFCFVKDYAQHLEEILNTSKHTDDEYDMLSKENEKLKAERDSEKELADQMRAILAERKAKEEAELKAEQERLESIKSITEELERTKAKKTCREHIAQGYEAKLQQVEALIMEDERKEQELTMKLLELEGTVKED